MGFWNPKNGDPDTDIVSHSDAGGTIDGIDILYNANQDETEAQNVAAFRQDIQRLGFDLTDFGGSITVDLGGDVLTLSVRKANGLYEYPKMVRLMQVVKYFNDQTKMDIVLAAETLQEAIGAHTNRLIPDATFITRNGVTDDPIMHFTPIPVDIAGANVLTYHSELFIGFVRHTLGFVPSSSAYVYTLPGTFDVEIKVGSSPTLNNQFAQIASTLNNATGVMTEWYTASIGDKVIPLGLRSLVL